MFATGSFGSWLKEYRKAHDLTRGGLAQAIGCSPETIHKIEVGARRPSKQIADLLADYLHIPPSERAGFIEFARGTGRSMEALEAQEKEAIATLALPSVPEHDPYPTNLRTPLTRLIGRDKELREIGDYLAQPGVRLLTLVGPPGIGKTRLSLQVGAWSVATLLHSFPDGVFFIPLSSTSDLGLFPDTIARTLGLEDMSYGDPLPGLIERLKEKEMLLLLDNFEQIVKAGPAVVELLESCPGLKVIVTSREVLHVRGEQQYPVPPLHVPDLAHAPTAKLLANSESVTLFVERARAVKPDFALTDENATAVGAICAQLGGMPLSIELIAARVKLLTPQALLALMVGEEGSKQLHLLTGGAQDLPVRHRTLYDAIDWSYNLLDGNERIFLNRLSVFAGGCTLAAIEGVCNAKGDLPMSAFEGISSLLDKSLAEQEQDSKRQCEPRVSMLEVIREFARERLVASSEENSIRRWHAEYYLALAEAADPQLTTAEQDVWFNRLECDHDNLLSALTWSVEHGEVEIAARLSTALARFWDLHAHLVEGRYWLERVLAQFDAQMAPKMKAAVLRGAGSLAQAQGDLKQAAKRLEESLALNRQIGDGSGTARSLNNLGIVYMDQGELERAALLFEESLVLRRRANDNWGIAATVSNFGLLELYRSNYERAVQLFEESLAVRKELGDTLGCAISLVNLGEAARKTGNYDQASEFFTEALMSLRDLGNKDLILGSLGGLATIASAQGLPRRAARLFGAEEVLREELGSPLPPVDRQEYERYVENARGMMAEATFKKLWMEGRETPLDRILEYAFREEAG
jgi:predicted ATPase/transcriptional regulator with XRE-family HTH domain/Tfp pilus assembly protein PilF